MLGMVLVVYPPGLRGRWPTPRVGANYFFLRPRVAFLAARLEREAFFFLMVFFGLERFLVLFFPAFFSREARRWSRGGAPRRGRQALEVQPRYPGDVGWLDG